MTPRNPLTPNCSFPKCTKAARTHGLCAEHVELVPWSERMRANLNMMDGHFKAISRERRRLARIALAEDARLHRLEAQP